MVRPLNPYHHPKVETMVKIALMAGANTPAALAPE
jgi:hypothetical protein